MAEGFRGDENVDMFDRIGQKFEGELNHQIDSMLADNSRWEAPTRKTQWWIYLLLGLIIGFGLALTVSL